MNSAVFDGRTVLSKTKDEQPHVVLLPTPEAESKAPGAPLQLHWVTTEALIVPTADDRNCRGVRLCKVLVVRPRVSVGNGDIFSNFTFCGTSTGERNQVILRTEKKKNSLNVKVDQFPFL